MTDTVRDAFTVNTIIGPGTVFSGDISAAGFVRIDGALRGNLTAKGRIVIGEKARMESDIDALSVVVGGVVKGNIYASESVQVLSTGLVIGDIVTRRLPADEGNLIHGRIVACGDDGDWNARISEYRDQRVVRATSSPPLATADRGDA